MRKQIGIGFLSVVFLCGFVWAADNTNIAMPLSQEGGTARAMSMGSAVVGMPSLGVASLFWNPAGLGIMGECMELGVYHNSGLGDTQNEKVAFGMPSGYLGGFAASLNYVDNGTFEGRDSAGNLTGNYTAGDLGGSVGWGKEWVRGFSAGAALKYNQETLATKKYEAYMATLGVLWSPVSRLSLGLVYDNIGTDVVGSRLDSGWRLGASYDVNKNLILAFSTKLHPDGVFDTLNAGIENLIDEMLALRAGYVYKTEDNQLDGISGVSVGLGVKIVKNIMLDYAYIPYGDLGVSQRISLTYKFACKKRPIPVPKKVVQAPVQVVEVKPDPVVEQYAVVLEKLIILEDTHFTYDTSTLTKDGAKIVLQNTQILQDNPEAKIRIAGYASAAGTAEYNQKLSERRAKAVKEILVKDGGIAPKRLITIGYGDTRPAMFEPIPEHINSKEARANMRVLFEIIVQK